MLKMQSIIKSETGCQFYVIIFSESNNYENKSSLHLHFLLAWLYR